MHRPVRPLVLGRYLHDGSPFGPDPFTEPGKVLKSDRTSARTICGLALFRNHSLLSSELGQGCVRFMVLVRRGETSS